MQITIDTQKDSKEDIRKAVAFLSSLAEGIKEHHSNIFEDSSPTLGESSPESAGGNAFANMFGDSDNTPVLPVNDASSEDESDEEKSEEVPEIMEY